jgi:glycerol-3-phosphate acyltransferase PlsX
MGAIAAAGRGVDIVLVGDEPALAAILRDAGVTLPIVHASQTISMGEEPARAIREKRDASVAIAAGLVAEGAAAGFVSAGSTGAALAAAAFIVGRLPGVQRPAVAAIFPTRHIVLDVGANLECKPSNFREFGVMGAALAEVYFELENPKVGLLSIGTEPGKGRELELAAYDLLAESGLDFVGNVEGTDLDTATADVIVTDGFTGNVLLKAVEGVTRVIGNLIVDDVLGTDDLSAESTGIIVPKLIDLRERFDSETYGGGHLVGTRGTVVIAHGSASRIAIANALQMAAEGASRGLVDRIAAGLAL